MTSRERIKAALTGKPVDRPPLNLGPKFKTFENELPDHDFLLGWMKEREFLELREYVRPWSDSYCGFEPPLFNRYMMVSANRISTETKNVSSDKRVITGTICLPDGNVYYEDHQTRGFDTSWHVAVPGDDLSALDRMISAPFEVHEESVRETIRRFEELDDKLGDNGYPNLFLPSPAVAVSQGMHLENFLELCFSEPETVHSYCKEITRRISICIDALFSMKKFDCAVIFGGSEQFTPPMMNPKSFDEFVVPYEGELVKQLKKYNIPIECHCHGKISYALGSIIKMGYDATDPVEPPPQGDITFNEARKKAGDKLTLVGNIEIVEIENGTPEQIKKHIRDILAAGKDRLIIDDAAGLRQKITERMYLNYKAWIDAYREYTI
ncbi:MAG: uroporphyrinogen decarboxylase family protein [Treponema sp.]|nr:uroporphyrinogen decarboxylase family protein [Treponema sp.]